MTALLHGRLLFLQFADRQPLVKDRAEYERLYKWSVEDPQGFWAHMAHDYFWAKKVILGLLCIT